MRILRTPDERFEGLADYPFAPHYTTIQTHDGSDLRIHHLDEGPAEGPVVLCMHGQPVWSYLYRHVIPHLTAAGMRVIAPDLVGYGKSDKPAAREDYSYQRQVEWMGAWLEANDLSGITFFGQDWGGLIGLRLVVNYPDRFDRVVISNTGLPYNPDVPQDVVDAVEAFRADAPTPSMPEMQKAIGGMGQGAHPASKFAYWQKWCWETSRSARWFYDVHDARAPGTPRTAVQISIEQAGSDITLADTYRCCLRSAFSGPKLQDGTTGDAQSGTHATHVAVA
jgi:haloalkane dehalogenase